METTLQRVRVRARNSLARMSRAIISLPSCVNECGLLRSNGIT
jgi:hypothetical protein